MRIQVAARAPINRRTWARPLETDRHPRCGAREALAIRESDLARANVRLAEDSRRDPLTGLLNRRALADDLRTARHGTFAVALCDVDRFNAYNDRLGHLAGDQALRALAATVRRELRTTDTAYRFGGEELLLVLRSCRARPRERRPRSAAARHRAHA